MYEKSTKKSTKKPISDKLKAQYKKGNIVEAKDYANKWYKSRVLELDEESKQVLVHFLGWNSRYDQWFDLNSNDIKPFSQEKQKNTSSLNTRSTVSTSNASNSKKTDEKSFKFEPGSDILAKWKLDNLFYSATILRNVHKGSILYYEVKFQDGFKQLVRTNNVREITEEDQIILDKHKEELQKEKLTLEQNKNEQEGNDKRRAEAELLLAIQNPHVKEPENGVTNEHGSAPSTDIVNQRKSTRVKRLKTFKDEIVYYPPSSSKTYNIVPELSTSQVTEILKSKRKLSTSSQNSKIVGQEAKPTPRIPVKRSKVIDTKQSKIVPEAETLRKKIEGNKNSRIKSYYKSLKIAKSNKNVTKKKPLNDEKLLKPLKSAKNLDEVQIKKKRKKKKDLIKKLIESSQLQLRKQQELIENQLKQHRHEKTKRKMLRLLKKQRLIDEQRNYAIEQMNQVENQPWSNNTSQFNEGTNLSKTSMVHGGLNSRSNQDPIRCNFSNCDKIFRKQSLLEYHLKYHHYVDMKTFNNFDFEQIILSTPSIQYESLLSKQPVKKTNSDKGASEKNSEESTIIDSELYQKIENDPDWKEIYSNDKNEDPYDVVHCACGNHSSLGFMIQCEICLCWQHGDCLNLHAKQVPDHHICWICTEPDNRLKQLKYKSWMQIKNERKSRELLDSSSDLVARLDDSDENKLKLLNLCSKKYFNLNLLMHTIEYQYSLMNKLCRDSNKDSMMNRAKLNNRVEKILMNILHLQDCATKKFEEFNKRLDEFEEKYQQNNKNALPRFFNLQELYKQLQTFVYA